MRVCHAEFLAAIGRAEDDLGDRWSPVAAQLAGMRESGMADVDCLWR